MLRRQSEGQVVFFFFCPGGRVPSVGDEDSLPILILKGWAERYPQIGPVFFEGTHAFVVLNGYYCYYYYYYYYFGGPSPCSAAPPPSRAPPAVSSARPPRLDWRLPPRNLPRPPPALAGRQRSRRRRQHPLAARRTASPPSAILKSNHPTIPAMVMTERVEHSHPLDASGFLQGPTGRFKRACLLLGDSQNGFRFPFGFPFEPPCPFLGKHCWGFAKRKPGSFANHLKPTLNQPQTERTSLNPTMRS